ncbi:MAG: UDP-N-acetylmuramoyl-tripeptide--D-alanyl-D-alanine ligase [Flavobacteriales bacterium]|nr:UDP-N-acetylmuramoyl-tripeptide--D-alanyl-D-alanine ligase [Flavobacteriales bacterium]
MNISEIYKRFLESTGVCTDTRKIEFGNVFFALNGPSFNGNEFAANAIEAGCIYAIIDEAEYVQGDKYILVDNVLETLQALANTHRKQMGATIFGITGSNGKTTTKELMYSVFSKKFNTLATEGNLNNHIGVPLTLLKLREEHEVAIIEMGANHVGEIRVLCEIAEPELGLITNIGKAHIGEFGGFENIIQAKMELFDYLIKNKGVLFVNADDPVLMNKTESIDRILYGKNESAKVNGEVINDQDLLELRVFYPDMDMIKTQLFGNYNFSNIMAAIATGHYLKIDPSDIKNGIEEFVPSNNRSQVLKTERNTVILDAYNANPSSMMAALENFKAAKGESKFVILGDMLELGNDSASEHDSIIVWTRENDMEGVFVGDHFAASELVETPYSNVEELISSKVLEDMKGRTILIKGSRGIKLEKLKGVL